MTLLVRKGLLLLPIGAFLVLVNLWVDPAYLFHQAGKKQMAAYMLEGKTATNLFHHDKRQALRYYVSGLTERKEVLILGSSRAMVFDASLFPDATFFNAAVPAGDLEDIVACYQVFQDAGLIPNLVIIGAEPYMLNGRYESQLHLRSEYRRGLERLGLERVENAPLLERWVDRRYRELISPTYFQEALGRLPKLVKRGRPVPIATNDPMPERRALRADGSLVFDRRHRSRTVEEVNKIAVAYVTRRVPGLSCFPELDRDRMHVFETFVEALLEDGIEVILLLPPFHPITYEMMVADREYRMLTEAQRYFERFAKGRGIPVYGSYDPKECGCDETEFVDGHHPKPETLMRVFRQARKKAVAGGGAP